MEQELIDTLKASHAESFGWALACCSWRRNEAEDVLQEAYLKVLDGRARFEGRSSAKTWFFAVIKRTASELARKQKRRDAIRLSVVHDDAPAPTPPDATAERSDETRQLLTALAQLPQRQREVLHLVFYSDETLEAAAAALSISVGSARTHYHRGKQRLAELLKLEKAHVD